LKAMHPRYAELLRHIRPALFRVRNTRRRVEERAESYAKAVELAGDRAREDLYVRQADGLLALAKDVDREALTTLVEAVFSKLGVEAFGSDDDLEAALRASLTVIQGGKRGA